MTTRLYAAGVLGGLAALAIAVVVVFAYGRHDPSPPSLASEPNLGIPGQVLFLDEDTCFVRAEASGAGEERLACTAQFFSPGPLYWLDEDTAGVIQYGTAGARLYEFDLATGRMDETGRPVTLPQKEPPFGIYGGAYAPDGTYAFFDEDGGLFLLQSGERIRIAGFDVPKYRQPQVILWAPDSNWLLAQYHSPHDDNPELWIISRDGQTRGTLTKDAGFGNAVAWRIEGVGVQPEVP